MLRERLVIVQAPALVLVAERGEGHIRGEFEDRRLEALRTELEAGLALGGILSLRAFLRAVDRGEMGRFRRMGVDMFGSLPSGST